MFGDIFSFDYEPYTIPFGSEEKLSLRSYSIQFERNQISIYAIINPFMSTVPSFAVRETDVSRHKFVTVVTIAGK